MEHPYSRERGWSRRLTPYLVYFAIIMASMAVVRLGSPLPVGTFGIINGIVLVFFGLLAGFIFWLVIRAWDYFRGSGRGTSRD